MCGIIGYIGEKDACEPIIQGLKLLEYRGYDSSGIAVLKDKKIQIAKKEGRIVNLEEYLKENPLHGNLAIGHTRWATHGKPSDSNAHPFVSQGQRYAVVHNGIIENYLEIKEELILQGITFKSKTDSEVVAHLVESLDKGDTKKAILNAAKRLKGSFALGIICVDDDSVIYALKKDNPLIVGNNDTEGFICSDINSLQKFLDRVVILDNYQMAVVKKGSLELFDFEGNSLKAEYTTLTKEDVVTSDNYECFMDKEIAEIPRAMDRALTQYINNRPFDKIDKEYLKNIKRIYIIGCGTALHAGMVGRKLIKRLVPDIDIYAEMASEFRYDDIIIDNRTLTITISQSGETADTLSCLRMVREKGGKVMTVCNVPTSSMVHYADYTILTNAGPEVAVASTKAYNCQDMILTLFAIDLAYTRGNINKSQYENYMAELKEIPAKAHITLGLRNTIVKLAQANYRKKSIFYLGRGLDYFVALEGSLKLKEISYIHCEAYAAGELKHGTIALIENDVLVIAVITQEDLIDKMYSSLIEVKTRGATIMVITPFGDNNSLKEVADDFIIIPTTNAAFYPMISVMPTQFLAYYVARAKGCDIDKPRNLAKSVTVE